MVSLQFSGKLTETAFRNLSIAFGVLFIVFFVIWIILNHKVFNWRPFTQIRRMIGFSIGSSHTSIVVFILTFLWYIFYFIPYLLLIIYGLIVAIDVEPYSFGIIFILACPFLISLFSIYQFYVKHGFSLKPFGKTLLALSIIFVFGITIVVLLLPEAPIYNWQSCGYFFAWPTIFLFALFVAMRRKKIADPDSLVIPETDDYRERIQDHQIAGTDKFAWYDYIILILFSALVSVIYYILFEKDIVPKSMKTATLATAILFFALDIFLLFIHGFKHNNIMTLSVTIVVLILKCVSVSFTDKYWFAGHGVIFFIIITYILTKFIFDVWCYNKYKVMDIKCEQIVDNLVLMTHGKRRIQLSEIIYQIILLVIVIVAIIVDCVLSWNASLTNVIITESETVVNYISQRSLTLYLIVIAVGISFSISGLFIMYQQNGHVDFPCVLIFIISGVLVLVLPAVIPMEGQGNVCMTLKSTTGLTIVAVISCAMVIIPTAFNEALTVFNSIRAVFTCETYESELIVFYASLICVIATVIDIILPFALDNCTFLGIIIVCFFFSIFFLISFAASYFGGTYYSSCEEIKTLIISIVATICFAVGCGGSLQNYYYSIGALLVLGYIECIAFGFGYERLASWDSSIRSSLFLIIPSILLAIASLIYTILANEVILPSILLFVFTALSFISILYLILKKTDFKFNIAAIIVTVIMALCLIAVLVYIGIELKDSFVIFTIIIFSIALVSFLACISIIISYNGTNSLVFTELFFPIYVHQDSTKLGQMGTLNALFIISQVLPYIWGLFGSLFFSDQQYAFLSIAFALGLMSVICCLLMCISDHNAMFALEYATRDIISSALESVRDSDAYAQQPSEVYNFDDIKSAKEFRKELQRISSAKTAIKRHAMLFNAELSVSSQTQFEFTKQFLYSKYQEKIPGLEYLLTNSNWSADERLEIFNISQAVKMQDTNEQAALMYYEYVEAQAKERMHLLNERDQMQDADTIVLPPDIDPDAAKLLQAEQEMQKLRDEIKQKEQENYRLQKLAEKQKQEMYQRRLEEDRRRKQEEEEERKRIQAEKNKEAAERRRRQAEERRRQEEERRRREEQEAEEERRRLEEQRRKAAQEAEEMRRRLAQEEERRRQELMKQQGLGEILGADKELQKVAQMPQSQYTVALSKLLRAKQKFNDPKFHPNMGIREDNKIAERLSKAVWNRLENQQKGIIETISQTRFMQGQLGDCYFCAAMCALAQDPHMIENLFDRPVVNSAYIHSVKFHRMGKVDHVAVDTVVPCYANNSTKACFVNFNERDDSYWPAIVEKAFAKYFGSYSAIDGGNSHVAMYYLTGEFPLRLSMRKDKTLSELKNGELWNKLYNWRKNGAFLCAGSRGSDDSNINNLGIVQGHAYTILGMYQVGNTQLLKLRNTWGDTEWKGDWSDNSSKWTPELRQRLGIENKNDGVFVMSLKDFAAHFESLYVLIRTKGLHRYELRTTFSPGELDGAKPNDRGDQLTQWRFTFTQPTKMYVLYEKTSCSSLHQVQMKKTDKKFKNHYVGDTVLHEGVVTNGEISSWIWDITEIDQPWFLLPYREKANDTVPICIQVFTDVPVQCERFD